MVIFGFDEVTIALLFTFAFFVLAAYTIIRLVTKVFLIAIISMAFPVALSYFGFYSSLSVNNILIFGILGSFLYITYFFVDRLLSIIWPFFESKKEKTEKHNKNQHRKKSRKEAEEVEIPEQ